MAATDTISRFLGNRLQFQVFGFYFHGFASFFCSECSESVLSFFLNQGFFSGEWEDGKIQHSSIEIEFSNEKRVGTFHAQKAPLAWPHRSWVNIVPHIMGI